MSRMHRFVTENSEKFNLGALFTEEEIDRAYNIFVQAKARGVSPNANIAAMIEDSALERIDQKVGHQNDPNHLAYLLQYAFGIHNGSTSSKTVI